jgi:hypothetical protein
MKRKMTTARAQALSVVSKPSEIDGDTLYPGTRGHIIWLRDERKNKLFHKPKEMTDFDSAEILFAYSTNPEKLQSIKGQAATAIIKKFSINLTHDREKRLSDHADEQLEKYIRTLTSPKKQPAQASRKPVARARKR